VYDKHGIQEVGALGGGGADDPSAFLAAVFGGERFHDYVGFFQPLPLLLFTFHPLQIGEISITKEITPETEVTIGEEGNEELNAATAAPGGKGSKDGKPVAGSSNEKTPGVSHPEQTTEKPTSSMRQDGPSDLRAQASATITTETSKEKEHAEPKLTPAQKAKSDIGEERDTAMDARIEELTTKLKDVSATLIPSPFIPFFCRG
jgi:hypothetical protein